MTIPRMGKALHRDPYDTGNPTMGTYSIINLRDSADLFSKGL